MNYLAGFVLAGAIFAVAQALIAALLIALLILVLMCAVTHPRQTFGLIAALGVLALFLAKPVICFVFAGVLGTAGLVVLAASSRRRENPAVQRLLIDQTHP